MMSVTCGNSDSISSSAFSAAWRALSNSWPLRTSTM